MAEQVVTECLVNDVELDAAGAERVSALLQMATGRLTVKGGADTLFRGHFEYATAQWRPEVHYEVADGLGRLEVKTPDRLGDLVGNPQYVWDLALGAALPVALKLHLGSGNAAMRLSETRLEALDVAVGSGQLQADLTGDLNDLARVSLKTGSGSTGLVLAGTYAALANVGVSTASGVANLALYGSYPGLRGLKVNSASGRLAVALGGTYPELEHVSLNTASGLMEVNLGQSLADDLAVNLNCVSGKAVVTYAPELGVSLRFTSMNGKIDAAGFTLQDGKYVNAAYAEAATRVEIRMSSVNGKLTLQPSPR